MQILRDSLQSLRDAARAGERNDESR